MNGHLLCAIDTETSGLKAGFNDLLQIAIVPLRPDLTPNTDIIPFHTKLQPKRPHNFDHESTKVHGTNLEDSMQYGMDPWTAVELFDQWFNSLKLPFKKLLIPLGHNYTFDKDFILDWMGGVIAYNSYFHGHVRDSMSAALFINDVADWQSDNILKSL
jgi:DNA polymerase III epsilon subunit-like protein